MWETVVPALYAIVLAFWMFIAGTLIASRRRGRLDRNRRTIAMLVPMWVMIGALWLWKHPAIEPLWLQYLLLIALPAVVGAGVEWIVGHVRASRSTARHEDRSISEGAR
ncbi:hypothetical protein [Microbacterium sp. NPDC087868]|uniref:hypothetical protein n=1 Tax=Microbacterium sp. NPDC087868 TaxID=3364195 RepID=UPI00384F1F62